MFNTLNEGKLLERFPYLIVNNGDKQITISVDVEKTGLDLDYNNICYIINRVYSHITFFSDYIERLEYFKKVENKGTMIVLTKHI